MNIGLTYTGSAEKHQNYLRWLQQNDADINIITLSAEPAENKGRLADCDGLVLSGGVDMHPRYYRSNNLVYANMPQEFYEKRDAFETSVFEEAQKNQLPVLGVCRGLQLVNCILGGTLQQDLGEQNAIHKAIVTKEKKQFDKAHGLHITAGTLLADLTGTERAVVNSAHHQCVQNIASSLMVNCVSDDNVAEGLEWKDKTGKPFLMCIQWHPERMYEFDLQHNPLSTGIRNLFINAIKTKAIAHDHH